eukprot:CAMPEP_0173434902 /NCGR_PEP_ID=MMETSP1357-20121228/13742_1 /TAXON_ID=77926 /ORGANISM="Hemiselmis rufescens, Strain PCC563" /LENGTH=42 /DNA_ID= /DNA_START= /DNA_END= /DNA_ORIENTATION=
MALVPQSPGSAVPSTSISGLTLHICVSMPTGLRTGAEGLAGS